MKKPQQQELSERLRYAMQTGGVFLNVRDGGQSNTMTISWGTLGIAWGRDVFMTMVRHSRHTHGMMENARCFTISIPRKDEHKDALSLCGVKSGRDMDKFAAAGLTPVSARAIESIIIGECDLHLECRVVCATELDPGRMEDAPRAAYADGDYHTLYFGEIVDCYLTDG